jgi:hypothetical protein
MPNRSAKYIFKGFRQIKREDVEILEKYTKIIDSQYSKAGTHLDDLSGTVAARQLMNYSTNIDHFKKQGIGKYLIIADKFYPHFIELKQEFKKHGMEIMFDTFPDSPFVFRLTIHKKGTSLLMNNEFARFNFDLYFNKNKEPSIILGNMQGKKKDIIDYFVKKYKSPLLNQIIQNFKKTFPNKDQTIALDPRFHKGYKNPHRVATWNILVKNNEIGKEEDYYLKKVEKMIDKKIEDIISHGTGMHKSAYKVTGYKKPGPKSSRYHFWRLGDQSNIRKWAKPKIR